MANCNHITSVNFTPSSSMVFPLGQSLVLSATFRDDAGPLPCTQLVKFRVVLPNGTVQDIASTPGVANTQYTTTWAPSAKGAHLVYAQGEYAQNGYPNAPTETTISNQTTVTVLDAIEAEVNLTAQSADAPLDGPPETTVTLPAREATVSSHLVSYPEVVLPCR